MSTGRVGSSKQRCGVPNRCGRASVCCLQDVLIGEVTDSNRALFDLVGGDSDENAVAAAAAAPAAARGVAVSGGVAGPGVPSPSHAAKPLIVEL